MSKTTEEKQQQPKPKKKSIQIRLPWKTYDKLEKLCEQDEAQPTPNMKTVEIIEEQLKAEETAEKVENCKKSPAVKRQKRRLFLKKRK